MAVAQLLFLAVITTASCQAQIKQTRGNECRHTCILSRGSPSSNRSTHCAVPIKAELREDVTLERALDPESQWILRHDGSISGQIVYFDPTPENRAVWILSQKTCLDHGGARGFPVWPMYQNLSTGPGSASPGLLGNFAFKPENEDIFKGCTENTIPWRNTLLKNSASENGTRIPLSTNQYVRDHDGNHEGLGVRLVQYEFKYNIDDLERVFERALEEAEKENPSMPEGVPVTNLNETFLRELKKAAMEKNPLPRGQFPLESNKPILLRGFPFMNGLSIITEEKIDSSEPRPDVVQDLAWLAWNRLQESVASLAAGPAPKVLLPEVIKQSDMLYITVLAVTSFLAFVLALKTIQNASKERVLRWRRPVPGHRCTFVTEPSGHIQLEQYRAPITRHDMYGAAVTFTAALIGIVGAVLTFRNSNLRYSKLLILRQGYLITYGPSHPKRWAFPTKTGQENQNAGAEFIVGVWLKAQFKPVGLRGVFEIIIVGYTLLGLALLLAWYRFSILRENQITRPLYRKPVQLFRAVIQAVIGVMARIPLAHIFITSYFKEYTSIAQDLAERFDIENFTERIVPSSTWDGSLRLGPRGPPLPIRRVPPNEEHIERAAAFLAGDKFGRLTYPQVLALLSNPDLVRAVDLYHRRRWRLSTEQVLCLSRLYSIKGVLIPEAPEGLANDEFDISENDSQLWTDKMSAVLLAVPDGDAPNTLPQFAVVRKDSQGIS